jgi:hypothetical protein
MVLTMGYMRISGKLIALGALKVINRFIVIILWLIQIFLAVLLYFHTH